ncbi:hypothetical protein Ancab_036133 [Ancistrocladus abbreviatus]
MTVVLAHWACMKQECQMVIPYAMANEFMLQFLLLDLGNQAFKQRQWQTAINFYTEATELNPDGATYYSNRAAAYLELGRPRLIALKLSILTKRFVAAEAVTTKCQVRWAAPPPVTDAMKINEDSWGRVHSYVIGIK